LIGASEGHGDGWRMFTGVGMNSIVGVDGGVSADFDSKMGTGDGNGVKQVSARVRQRHGHRRSRHWRGLVCGQRARKS
jgi:hypothetical protein